MWLFITAVLLGDILQQKFSESWPDPHLRSKGAIWPQPQYLIIGNESTTVNLDAFTFVSTVGQCEIIDKAIIRYHKRLFGEIRRNELKKIKRQNHNKIIDNQILSNLTITVEEGCTNRFPQFGMDESYKLIVTSNDAVLRANQVWGVLRGMESFAQLFFDRNTKIHKVDIRDYPRFFHRGVLLDTARHYLSVNVIKANIELMAQNKFNTFHWHIVDIESFPYQSEVIPELIKGAYTPNHIYTISQIKDIIDYGRLRGIRVLPEFDTPGHMKSWGIGVKDLLTKCYHSNGSLYQNFENLLDPTNSNTWDVLSALFQEVFAVFPENYVHLGGDEAEYWFTECWTLNPTIRQFMEIYGLKDGPSIQAWYFSKFVPLLHSLKFGKNKKFLVWQEVISGANLTINMTRNDNLIAHIWKNTRDIEYATKLGYYVILSACWYLDLITSTADWKLYYSCDPQDFNGTEAQKHLVIGGEAALWGEWVDESNVIPRLWPRASAVAERLWSSVETKSIEKAWPRLYEMQCRMASQGYPVQPTEGPGYCENEYKIQLPLYE
ncbi:Glycosyl hydrolase family 20, catalytic domain containing protein [Brugia malayi]|uniref:Beta-hexosaminidase n=1 Tax=Brugia malayi TaxID=6279 RepID=A0A4E9EV86_BRUMA|nr:Glycosyl hydrolase family 20, catalytic domain containing protein [Brugia malayi]VIO88168.1 Glycosyl hydrolase family 20, catalytic domain containing protein [Brugia malayi]